MSAKYLSWVAFGEVRKPTAPPARTGRRIETAGLAKTAAGSVREGMKVVILEVWVWLLVDGKLRGGNEM